MTTQAAAVEKNVLTQDWRPDSLSKRDITRANWIAFFAWVFAVYDFILFGMLLPVMGGHFQWDEAAQAELATWVSAGGAIIAFAIGPVVDRVGRRKGIIFAIGGAAISSALTAVCAGMGKGSLIAVRSVAGLGYAEQGVNATYLSEIYGSSDDPEVKRRRGFIYSLVQSGWPVGALIAAGLTALLMPYIGWQGCFIFAAIPGLLIAIFARKLKESPQFQVLQRINELRKAGMDSDAKAVAVEYGVDFEEHSKAGVAAAFRGAALRPTLVLSAAILLNWSAAQVFNVLGTSVLVSVHGISFENSLWILVLSNSVGFLGYLFHGWLGDRIGRRNTIAIGWMCGGAAFYAMLQAPHEIYTVVTLYSLGLFFQTGSYAAMLFFTSESYPISIRATGGSIINAMGPMGAILAGVGITSTLSTGGDWHSAALWFGALPCFLSGLVMLAAKHVDPKTVR